MVVSPMKAGEEGLGEMVKEMATYFYADDGFITPPRTERLQRLFDVLTEIFNQVTLRMNIRKMVSMEFRPCHALSELFETVYE